MAFGAVSQPIGAGEGHGERFPAAWRGEQKNFPAILAVGGLNKPGLPA